MALLNADEFRRRARRRLPRGLFEYIDRGAEDETALARLRASLDRVILQPAALAGSDNISLATTVFGMPAASPLIIAPTALAGLVAPGGEIALARAAAQCAIPYCMAMLSITAMEDIRAGAPDADLWFQLYLLKDRAVVEALLARARNVGCDTLVLTIDNQVAPNREYNERNGFGMPIRVGLRNTLDVACHPSWAARVLLPHLRHGRFPRFANLGDGGAGGPALDPTVCWDDLARLRDAWPGKLIVKGVLSAQDAHQCRAMGADGVVVSSHGGRNLDVGPSPADCLAQIRETAPDGLTVLADSGVRRGSDVLKYIALGAEGVLLGRLPLWGLATGGEQGAIAAISVIHNEMRTAMAFLGARQLSQVEQPTQ